MASPEVQTTRRPPRRTRGKPTNVDVHVGQRIRLRRTLLGMSQERLAEALDLTFQQVQKYERGANRVGAGRLHQLSRALDVPVSYFFEGLEDGAAPKGQEVGGAEDLLSRRESLDLIRAYDRIVDPAVRQRLRELIRAIAEGGTMPAGLEKALPERTSGGSKRKSQ